MKKSLLILLTFLCFSIFGYGQEISLFDSTGEAKAYIDFNEDATIFLWDGTPVAFIENDRNDLCVFGFNGRFLGWYENGIIYDKQGYVVGSKKGVMNMIYRIERIKSIQRITPIRLITSITPIKPFWKNSWSSSSLTELLYFGKK
jgi:hypothetical protein